MDRSHVAEGAWWLLIALVLNRLLGFLAGSGAMLCILLDAQTSWQYALPYVGMSVPVLGFGAAVLITLATTALQSAVLVVAVQSGRPLRMAPRGIVTVLAVLVYLLLPALGGVVSTVISATSATLGMSALQAYSAGTMLSGVVGSWTSGVPFVVAVGYVTYKLRTSVPEDDP